MWKTFHCGRILRILGSNSDSTKNAEKKRNGQNDPVVRDPDGFPQIKSLIVLQGRDHQQTRSLGRSPTTAADERLKHVVLTTPAGGKQTAHSACLNPNIKHDVPELTCFVW